MGITTMIKAVLILVWICVIGAQHNAQHSHFINPGTIIPGSQVFFPGEIPRQPAPSANNRQSGTKLTPRCADGLEENAPCIDDVDYNANIQARFRFLLHRFRGSEVVTNDVFQALTTPEKIGDPSDGIREALFTPVCASKETILYPKRAKTQSNDWVFVLNQGRNKQAVKVEKCINNNRPCNLGAAGTEIQSVCRQKYIYKKLLVMTSAGTDIVPESVLMPSCCVCYKKQQDRGFAGFAGFGSRNRNFTGGGNNSNSNNGQANTSNSISNRGINQG